MNVLSTELDRKLCRILCDHPKKYNNRYTAQAKRDLIEKLFRALTNDRDERFRALFPNGLPDTAQLQSVQRIQAGIEYSPAAKGHACGHILQAGEANYNCMTCTDDETCVLCAPCFNASDHEGHQFRVLISPGNSGCCDCGDEEAFKRPLNCAIHTAAQVDVKQDPGVCLLPEDFQCSISTTIGRVLDYFCDVISCSPENLRLPKTNESVKHDETTSRLSEKWYPPGDEHEANPEYCLVLWNDEKHTVEQVEQQVARACRASLNFGKTRANETNDIGRSLIRHSRNIPELIKMCQILEQIKITVTIRSSRDTFREQMCGTIIEWLSDIACCSIQGDHSILRQAVCQQMTREWRIGSEAPNAMVGKSGLFDNEKEDVDIEREYIRRNRRLLAEHVLIAHQNITMDAFDDDDDDDDEEDEPEDERLTNPNEADAADGDEEEAEDDDDDEDQSDAVPQTDTGRRPPATQVANRLHLAVTGTEADSGNEGLDGTEDGDEMDTDGDFMDIDGPAQGGPVHEAQPPPPQPAVVFTPADSEDGDIVMHDDQRETNTATPKVPDPTTIPVHDATPDYWTRKSPEYSFEQMDPLAASDAVERLRLDSLILFDLRLWKEMRIKLRSLLISTVVNIPHFKRILGVRFAMLYTTLSQLYLVADREPDHSVIHLSLQMLTTPSITKEVIEKGNFLTTLMAILYTFLTTRQVGYPKDVDSQATLAFDTGSVTNRRLLSSFHDLRFFLASEFVQQRVRTDNRYLKQFLDLAKLSQGICPNTRAVGEHVEYETDAWINASLLTKEMNKLCREFAASYREKDSKQPSSIDHTCGAIFDAACVTIVNSIGLERKRFIQSEIKEVTRFKEVNRYSFEIQHDPSVVSHPYRVVDFVVQNGSLSFHHALHYTLSWLIEFGKISHQALEALDAAAMQVVQDLQKMEKVPLASTFYHKDDALLAMFDYPLRLCAWLAQMKAGGSGGMWVRNGASLRHQWMQYRSVVQRDVGYQRDLTLLQTALVACDPGRVLATMIDRYGMQEWMRGDFTSPQWREDGQSVDMAEEFIFLLINLLSDRDNIIPQDDEMDPQMLALRKDIVHTLCFKPLSFSDLSLRLTERHQKQQELQNTLEVMTNFRAPEGLHDSGLFELKPEFLRELDPYNSNFSKNQRDEAEAIYRRWMAKTTGKAPEDIVLEPNLRPIKSGVFVQLAAVTRTPLFTQVIYYTLEYALEASTTTPDIPTTRIEALLHVVLQLALIATLEDELDEDFDSPGNTDSFVRHALSLGPDTPRSDRTAIITILQQISNIEAYESCRGKIKHLLRMFVRKREFEFKRVTAHLEFPYGRLDTASPANMENEVEAKKKQALERKAKVMAQFQQQQQSFINNQGTIDWGDDDFSDTENEAASATETHVWKYPSGVCIHCREDVAADCRLYGTFSMVVQSGILRPTPFFLPDPALDEKLVRRHAQLTDEEKRDMSRLVLEMVEPLTAEELNRILEVIAAPDEQGIAVERRSELGPRDIDPYVSHFREAAIMEYKEIMLIQQQQLLRSAGCVSHDYIREVIEMPASLDVPLNENRPFGISGWNHEKVIRLKASGEEIEIDRQCLGKGWPMTNADTRIMTSCGHIMHFACFTNYYASVQRRQSHQISRNHPERISQLEFVCPLCKAAGNTFLPVAFKTMELSYPGVLEPKLSLYDTFVDATSTSKSFPTLQRERKNKNLDTTQQMRYDFVESRRGLSVTTNTREGLRSAGMKARDHETPGDLSMTELRKVFDRLRNTLSISVNERDLADRSTPERFNVLVSCFANTIAATEIAHRGLASEYGMTLLSKISSQTITHLRVLSSDIRLYAALSFSGLSSKPGTLEALQEDHLARMIFPPFDAHNGTWRSLVLGTTPLLMQDAFTYLAETSMTLCHVSKFEPHHLLELCYTAELMRVVLAYHMAQAEYSRAVSPGPEATLLGVSISLQPPAAEEMQGVANILKYLAEKEQAWRELALNEKAAREVITLTGNVFSILQQNALVKVLRSYATAFLRKAIVLFNVAHNVEFPANTSPEYNMKPELERLSQLLGLQSIGAILSNFSVYTATTPTEALASRWLTHYFEYSMSTLGQRIEEASTLEWAREPEDPVPDFYNSRIPRASDARSFRGLRPVQVYCRIPLLHPCRPELVGLPEYYDVLIDLAHHRCCGSTGKELTDPALCLFCGAIFCGQAVCCRQDGKLGGCNRHITETKCGGGTIGMFLMIRKCMVALLHIVPMPSATGRPGWQSNGAWFQAPYLTKHGEHDFGLRTKEQLILNQKRYDKLYREAWLCVRGGSEVWSMIARKLEGDVNHGGWETL